MTETPELPPRRQPRRRQTVGDMVRSLVVVLVLVGVVVAFNVVDQPDPVLRDVNVADAVSEAATEVPYDVLAPDPLPVGWRATSARSEAAADRAIWHLGLVTARENYAGVEQTDGPRRAFLDEFVEGARPAGDRLLGGRSWQRLEGGSPDPRGLVSTADGVTTLLTGTARWSELARLAESLRAG